MGPRLQEDAALKRLPLWTLAALALAFAVYAFDGAAEALVYDRRAIASGELWRLLTAHWVHLSPAHLLYNALGLAIAGTLLETQRHRLYPALLLAAPAVIGIALYCLDPDLARYGGLSGIVFGAAVYLAACGLGEAGPWRWICAAALVGMAGKFGLEMSTHTPLLTPGEFTPVPLSHAVGACVGVGFAVPRSPWRIRSAPKREAP